MSFYLYRMQHCRHRNLYRCRNFFCYCNFVISVTEIFIIALVTVVTLIVVVIANTILYVVVMVNDFKTPLPWNITVESLYHNTFLRR